VFTPSLVCSHQTLRLNWTVLLSSDESCRKSVHTRKLYVNTLTLRLNWSRQFLRFWTFQSQLSRDLLTRDLLDLLLSLGVNPFATATDWDCRPQAMAAAVRQTWSRLTTIIIIPSRLVWTRLRSDSTQLDKTGNAQNKKLVVLSLVEMGQIIDVFAPINAPTQLNCFVQSDLLVRTRLKVWWMVRHTNVVLCKHGSYDHVGELHLISL
jgi:hypothetical protein